MLRTPKEKKRSGGRRHEEMEHNLVSHHGFNLRMDRVTEASHDINQVGSEAR
jgi:hypothetical protein